MVVMGRKTLIVGAALAVGALLNMVLLGGVPHAKAEPLEAACTTIGPQHRDACALGYMAPNQSTDDCEGLYAHDSTIAPQLGHAFLKPDYLAGCEAAKRQLSAQGF